MANEIIRVYGTTKTLEASGAASSSIGDFVQANDAAYSVSADGSSYPDAEFVLSLTLTAAPAAMGSITLVARPINVDGTGDTPVPDSSFPGTIIGAFPLDNTTALQYSTIVARDVPQEAEYYLINTIAAFNSGWTLKVKPRTIKPAP